MFKVLDKGERKIGPVAGGLLVFTYAYGALDLAAFEFITIYQDELTTLVYTCLAEDINSFKPEFEKSLGTLKWEPSKKQ